MQAVQNLVRKYQENYVESEESGEREFWVAFYNLPKKLALRGLQTQQIGRLVRRGSAHTLYPAADLGTHGTQILGNKCELHLAMAHSLCVAT